MYGMRALVVALAVTGATAVSAQTITVTPDVETEFRTYITTQKVEPVQVDAEIAVGQELPDTVVLQPVPEVIVTKSPDFKGYRYAVVDSQVVIVEPESTKIVAVIKE